MKATGWHIRLVTLLALTMAFATEAAVSFPLPAYANPVKKPVVKGAVAQAKIPPDSVSAAEALKRIETHMKTIADRKAGMSTQYDYYTATATMTEAFRRNGANQWVIDQYAGSWGQNGLYLTWDVVQQFYGAHYDALKDSAGNIKMKHLATVKKSDLAYLDQGMTAWNSKEKEVQVRMQHILDTKGKMGAEAGISHDNWRAAHDDPYMEALHQKAEAQYHHLKGIVGTLDSAVRNIGYKTRLFSSISATERIVTPTAVTNEERDPNIKMAPGQ